MLCSLLSISNRSLLEDTNAISIPEKNAEKAMVINISMIKFISFLSLESDGIAGSLD